MNKILSFSTTLFLAGFIQTVQAQSTWNAYSDFYLSPTAAGWGGATSPSAAGAAWGYYMGNVNGSGFPASIGSYLTTSQIYRYSNYDPLGAGGPVYSTSGWAATGGAGFPYYLDNVPWGVGLNTSLGRYDTPWFSGAPGANQSLANLIWMQPVWLNGPGVEGIATVLTWTAPQTGDYSFAGRFVSGNQPGNGASVAIVDSLSTSLMSRTSLANDTLQAFSFTASYTAGDVVEFQVGSDFTTGNAVGLQLDINVVPEPSALALLGLGGLALILRRRK